MKGKNRNMRQYKEALMQSPQEMAKQFYLPLDDHQLLQEIYVGSQTAHIQLILKYLPKLRESAYEITQVYAESEEIMSELIE